MYSRQESRVTSNRCQRQARAAQLRKAGRLDQHGQAKDAIGPTPECSEYGSPPSSACATIRVVAADGRRVLSLTDSLPDPANRSTASRSCGAARSVSRTVSGTYSTAVRRARAE